jgi:hypothetical protein
MKYIPGNNYLIAALSITLIVFTLHWIAEDRTQTTLLEPILFGSNNSSIKSIDAEFSDKKLHLNIHLSEYTSCKEVVKLLDIRSLVVKNKTYTPTCSNINKSLVRITYSEAVEA